MQPKDIFLAKLFRKQASRVGIGSATSVVTTDLMANVKASFPEAHLDAEVMAQLAAAGHTVLGFDNVKPLFSVWHESAALGCPVDWGNKSQWPDGKPIYSAMGDITRVPRDFLKQSGCAVPLRALQLLQQRMNGKVAVVGKVFGPWTLGYHLFGVEEFLMATLLEPDAVKRALRKLIEVTVAFANAQVDCGAEAITLADHCTQDLCSPETYRDFLFEIHQELQERIRCPVILHICGNTADRLQYIRETKLACFHFDSKVPAAKARELAGRDLALMGGTSNFNIVRSGTRELITKDIAEKLHVGIDIVGPECAVPLDTPYENLRMITEVARKLAGEPPPSKTG
jgi:[methyl-Co(III) methanol-specific corrinoid protein]:coenzyme M methyltransferase